MGRLIWSSSPKRVILVEHDIPLEERVDESNARKKGTYQDLTDTCRDRGCCGFPSQSVSSLLGVVNIKGRLRNSTLFGKLQRGPQVGSGYGAVNQLGSQRRRYSNGSTLSASLYIDSSKIRGKTTSDIDLLSVTVSIGTSIHDLLTPSIVVRIIE